MCARLAQLVRALTPGAPLTNFNDGEGVRQKNILYPKNHNFRICLPIKITTFLAYLQNPLVLFSQPQKNPSVFILLPKEISAYFIDPKKSLLVKISDPKNSLGFPVVKISGWDPWISDCQPGSPGFNPRPGRGLNFRRPSFATPSVVSGDLKEPTHLSIRAG